jgi:Icc-related predicted phosphoesterase
MDESDMEKIRENFISAQEKLQKGVSPKELTQGEQDALEYARRQQEEQQRQLQTLPETERNRFRFNETTSQFAQSGGKRIIHITDTESSPDDLEKIIAMNLQEAGGLSKNDIVVHTGDLLQDFIDFKNMHHGLQGFRAKRIVEEGNLEEKIANEFSNAYEYLLEKNGIADYQLLEGQISEQLVQGLQRLYFGVNPHFLTKEEQQEYNEKYETFKKHLTTAIKNNAKEQYEKHKNIFKEKGLNSENLILLPGNHDVPEIMQEVLSEYMAPTGKAFEKKGVKFASPLSGSTGAHLGPEFGDVFGYTDYREKLEKAKYNTPAFQELLEHMKSHGIDFVDEKHLSQLIMMSQQRSAQGIGQGELAKYFDDRIKPQLDSSIDNMRGQIVNSIPENVDFFLFHGMPNHPSYAGIEENAAYKAIDKKGGNILHGHIHGKTTHRMGNSMLLNQGDGKANFGIYHLNDKNNIEDILSRTVNQNLGIPEYDIIKPEQLKVQPNQKEYS